MELFRTAYCQLEGISFQRPHRQRCPEAQMEFHGKDLCFLDPLLNGPVIPCSARLMYQIFSWAPLGEEISRHLSDCAITADGFHHLMSAIEDSNLCSDFSNLEKKNEGAFCGCEQWGVGWVFHNSVGQVSTSR